MKRNLLDKSTKLNDWTCSRSYLQKKKTVPKSEQLVKFEYLMILKFYYYYFGVLMVWWLCSKKRASESLRGTN